MGKSHKYKILGERRWNKRIYSVRLYLHQIKKQKKNFMVRDVKISVTTVKAVIRRGTTEISKMLEMLCFLICVLVLWSIHFVKTYQDVCTYNLYTIFMYIYFILKFIYKIIGASLAQDLITKINGLFEKN